MKVQIGSLTVVVDSLDELDQLVQRYGQQPQTRNDAVTVQAPPAQPPQRPSKPKKPAKQSPLAVRVEELREQHGPVFVIDPKEPVQAGQQILWGKPSQQKKVEIIEPAELAGDDGKFEPGRWFAKLVEV